FGPSGAGKTTMLDAIAGLRRPARGTIAVDGRTLFSRDQRIDVPSYARHIGYVPQDVALFPHMNVRANLLYGSHPPARSPLRRGILPYLARVRDELRIPIVYVSHDRDEVDALADAVVRMEDGRVVS